MSLKLKQEPSLRADNSRNRLRMKTELRGDPEARETKVSRLQRCYGNQSAGKIWASYDQEVSSEAAAKGLSASYAAAVKIIGVRAKREQQLQLWRSFEVLSPGQKQAVLLELERSLKGQKLLDHSPIDWMDLLDTINRIKAVRLEVDEAEREGDADQFGARSAHYQISLNGLLPPYLDIAAWLNYKANKQGESVLMKKFESLSLAQKKIAIHKMAKRHKLRFHVFTKEMIVINQQMEWIDWDKMRAAMDDAEKIKLDAKDAETSVRYLGYSDELNDFEDKQQYEHEDSFSDERKDALEGKGLGWLAPGMIGEGGSDAVARETEPVNKLSDPDFLNWLLFGIKGALGAADSKQKAKLKSDSPETIVDRFLQIDSALPHQAHKAIRQRRLKDQGYISSKQCYVYLLALIVAQLYERGVVKREKPFANVIVKLGLFGNNMPPTKQRIAERLSTS